MALILRRAEPGDTEAICELATILVGFDADATLRSRDASLRSTSRRGCFEGTLTSPDHDVVVAEVNGTVVGYAHLMVYPDLTHGALAGELLGLIVREEMRRKGIATALMREIIRLARQRGVGEFHINTEQDNDAAKGLHAGLGAEVVGVQMEIALE
jgi:ribosomal protein S18 acetylase RimI-like enzyme